MSIFDAIFGKAKEPFAKPIKDCINCTHHRPQEGYYGYCSKHTTNLVVNQAPLCPDYLAYGEVTVSALDASVLTSGLLELARIPTLPYSKLQEALPEKLPKFTMRIKDSTIQAIKGETSEVAYQGADAIQSVINTMTKGDIAFEDGTYIPSSTLIFDGKNDVRLLLSKGTVLKAKDGLNNRIIQINSNSNRIEILGGLLDGNKTNQTDHNITQAIVIVGGTGHKIDTEIKDCAESGLHILGGSDMDIRLITHDNYESGLGILKVGATTPSDITVHVISYNNKFGVDVGQCRSVTIDFIVHHNSVDGIACDYAEDLTLDGITHNNTHSGLSVSPNCKKVKAPCVISYSNGADGIESYAPNCEFDCLAYLNYLDGIRVGQGGDKTKVRGIYFNNNQKGAGFYNHGAELRDVSRCDVKVIAYDDQGTKTQSRGLYVVQDVGTCDYNIIIGNNAWGNRDENYYITGNGNSEIHDNVGCPYGQGVLKGTGYKNTSPSITNVTASRALGTWYQNTSGKTKVVYIAVTMNAGGGIVQLQLSPDNGTTVYDALYLDEDNRLESGSIIVSDGWYCRAYVSLGGATLYRWHEQIL